MPAASLRDQLRGRRHSLTMTTRRVRWTVNPLTWFRRIEDGLFALAAEAEYRLRLAPRGAKIVPSDFDRRMIRLFLVALIFVLDARSPQYTGRGRPLPPPKPRKPVPPPSQPHWTRRRP